MEIAQKPVETINITTVDDERMPPPSTTIESIPDVDGEDDDDDEEPSVLGTLSDDQMARRPSFKKILEDLSAAGANLQKGTPSGEHLSAAAVATLQAQAALHQAAASSGGVVNPAVFSGVFQGLSSQPEATTTSSNTEAPAQIPMMLPTQQQLQTAILNASSGVVQSLANQTNIPANLLSSALINANMAATLNATGAVMSPGSSMLNSVSAVHQNAPGSENKKKREVRLMKNREAARECRRKKKEYVRCLENRVSVLESQNQALIGELRALKELYLPKSQD